MPISNTTQALADACDQDQRLLNAIRGLIFLGCPHKGVKAVWVPKTLARSWSLLGANVKIFDEIRHNSVSLERLHTSYRIAIRGKDVRVVNFYERRPTSYLPIYSKILVGQSEATYESPASDVLNLPLPTDHSGLNKYASRNSPGYQQLRDTVVEMLQRVNDAAVKAAARRYLAPSRGRGVYTDRKAINRQLEEALLGKIGTTKDYAHTAILLGAAGMGKTQLALEFCRQYRNEYDAVLWIDARSENSLKTSFGKCCEALDIAIDPCVETSSTLGSVAEIRALHQWLQGRTAPDQKWLMVVDNADDLTWGIKDTIPCRGTRCRGSVLITSQDSACTAIEPSGARAIMVDQMTDEEAVALLLDTCTNTDGPNDHIDDVAPTNGTYELALQNRTRASENTAGDLALSSIIQDMASQICHQVHNYPLAIDLAGAWIRNHSESTNLVTAMKQYIADFKSHHDELLKDDQFIGLSNSRQSVSTIWNTTFSTIEKRSLTYKCPPLTLLAFLSCFAFVEIQRDVFAFAGLGIAEICARLSQSRFSLIPQWLQALLATNADGEWDDFCFRRSMAMLQRYHLVQQDSSGADTYSMHGMVFWRATQDCREPVWMQWYVIFMAAVCQEVVRSENPTQFKPLLLLHLPTNHVVGALEHLDDAGICYAHLYMGKIWETEERYVEARHHYKHAMRAGARCYRSDLPRSDEERLQEMDLYMISLTRLASVWRRTGGLDGALRMQQKLLAINTCMWGPMNPSTLRSQVNLAVVHYERGDYAEAAAIEKAALHSLHDILGEKDKDVIDCRLNLAASLRQLQQYDLAAKHGMQVVASRTEVHGASHPETLNSMSDLAITYTKWNRISEAITLEESCVSHWQQSTSPPAFRSASRLADLYCTQGRQADAERIADAVLETTLVLELDRQSMGTAMAVTELGILFADTERGRRLLMRAAKMLEKLGKAGHSVVVAINAALERQTKRLASEKSGTSDGID